MESLPKHHLLEFQPDTLEAIRKLYNFNDPRNLAGALDVLETWIKQQNHFLKKDYERSYLEKTLITCKGSIEKAKSQINNLCTMKTLLPSFFIECNIKEEFSNSIENVSLILLPKLTKDYHRVVMLQATNKPFQASQVLCFYRLNFIILEYIKAHDYCNGFIGIYDLRELNIMDVLNKMSLVELQQFVKILVEGYGARIKSLHILSNSKLINIFVNTLKSLLSAKIGNRIFVHSSNEDIQAVVSKDLLPIDYGGEQKPIKELHREWIDELSSATFRKYLKMIYGARTNEMYRQTDKFNEEYMGMPGSFRALSVD